MTIPLAVFMDGCAISIVSVTVLYKSSSSLPHSSCIHYGFASVGCLFGDRSREILQVTPFCVNCRDTLMSGVPKLPPIISSIVPITGDRS